MPNQINEKPKVKMDLGDVIIECFKNEELVKQFNRLTGCTLGQAKPRSPLDAMIDKACNYTPEMMSEDDMGKFCRFVYDYVWTRLPPESFVWELA